MGFDWTKAAESKGAANMDEGWHYCKVGAVYTANKDGKPYESNAGRYIIVSAENENGEQASMSLWCTPKAAWKIAAQLSALGVSPNELERAGVDPTDFTDQTVAVQWLVGRFGYAYVEHKGKYANLEFFHEDKVPVNMLVSKPDFATADTRPLNQHESIEDEDIPF
jgi:hypothetical protein